MPKIAVPVEGFVIEEFFGLVCVASGVAVTVIFAVANEVSEK